MTRKVIKEFFDAVSSDNLFPGLSEGEKVLIWSCFKRHENIIFKAIQEAKGQKRIEKTQ